MSHDKKTDPQSQPEQSSPEEQARDQVKDQARDHEQSRQLTLDTLEARRRDIEQRLRQDLDKLDALRREVEQKVTLEVEQLVAASGHSMRGLKFAARHERAFRLELLLSLIFVPLAFYLGESFVERGLLISVIGLVLVTELLNSAIEATVDRISLERHELSGRAKDLGSAAVWISLLIAGVVWADKILSYF